MGKEQVVQAFIERWEASGAVERANGWLADLPDHRSEVLDLGYRGSPGSRLWSCRTETRMAKTPARPSPRRPRASPTDGR